MIEKKHQGKESKHGVLFLTATNGSIKSNWKAGLLILFIVATFFGLIFALTSLTKKLSKPEVSIGNYFFVAG